MKQELYLQHAIVSFENLDELMLTLDEGIELRSHTVSRYENRLGGLLRGNPDQGEQKMMLQIDSDNDQKKSRKAKEDRKSRGEVDDPNWLTLGDEEFSVRISSQRPEAIHDAEVSVLFKVIEALKTKLAMLELAKKLLAELPTHGFRVDQKILVVFRDGIPRQVIPTLELGKQTEKFRYAEKFEIQALN